MQGGVQKALLARSAHDEHPARLAVHDCRRVAVTVVKTLAPTVAIGNHAGLAPRPAAIAAESAHDVDAPVAADVIVAAMAVIGDGEQSAVKQLHNGRNAIVLPPRHIGVEHDRLGSAME